MLDKKLNFVHLTPINEIDLLSVKIKMMDEYNSRTDQDMEEVTNVYQIPITFHQLLGKPQVEQ